MTRLMVLVILLGTQVLTFTPASAAVVSYTFTGGQAPDLLTGGIALPSDLTDWTTFSGTLQIDDSILDSQANVDGGSYSGAALSMDVSYNTGFSISGSGGEVAQIRNTSLSNSSWYAQQFSPLSTDLATSLQLITGNLWLYDHDSPSQNLFTDPNTLLSALPAPGSVTQARLEMIFTDGIGGTAYVRGYLTDISAVPEPSAGVLAIVACVLIGWQRKRFQLATSRRPRLR